jgi:hypothetical protein
VDDVVEDRDLEDAEEHRAGIVAGEGHLRVAGGDPGDEAEDADECEDGSGGERGLLDGRAVGPCAHAGVC